MLNVPMYVRCLGLSLCVWKGPEDSDSLLGTTLCSPESECTAAVSVGPVDWLPPGVLLYLVVLSMMLVIRVGSNSEVGCVEPGL